MMQLGIRRHRTGRAVMTAASVGVLLAAAFATSAHAGAARHAAAAKKPASGGSYSERLSSAADCLDPQKTSSATANGLDGDILDTLLSIDNKGHYVADLATGYKVSNGGTHITFTLRKNVRFSNGDPFTATDVKFTFDRAIDPATKSPVTATYLAALQSVKVISKYVVELLLKQPSRPLLTNLSNGYTGILDHKSVPTQSNTCDSIIGTGPYKIQSTGTAFSDVVLVANKYHNFAPAWIHNKGVPYIPKIDFPVIASDATAISELLSTGVDIAGIPGTQLSRVQGNSSIVQHKVPPTGVVFLEFNTTTPPFSDPQMRKAFTEIVNRTDIISAAYSGLATPAGSALAPAVAFYDKTVVKYLPKTNPSDASRIVAAKHPGPISLLTVGIPAFTTTSEILQQAAGQAGMQVNIASKGGLADFLAAANKGQFNVILLSVGEGTDPDILYSLLDSTQGGGKGINWTGDSGNYKLDNLLSEGRVVLKSSAAAKVYSAAQKLINQQMEFIPVVYPIGITGIRSTIHGYHTNSQGVFAVADLYMKTK